ncbi:MAG: protein kinase [Pyrinomonadaceae bacterium]
MMTPERYRQIDQIFQAALGLKPEERAGYLDEACSGDELLRQEIESLITSDQGGLSFINQPAFEMGARVLASDEPALAAGDLIDRYEVVSLLGSGGMGEVYLAHDEKLDRKIALKLLPSHFTMNEERLRRFQQEARAASALNHPNIITIHEIGQVENRNFIATEFVDGETLRQRMKHGPLSLNESLDIAIQVCGALAAAHNAGIVHRDIKPENIMLRRDGYVKVLDFGLAKLTEQREQPTDVDAADNVDISSGLLMGTVKYMSPEQAQGQQVDPRSDIFSLGVVLYEMVTGHAPFKGEDTTYVVTSILKDQPPRLTEYAPRAPEELQRIVSRALIKNTAQRYQTAEDFLFDLKTLKQKFELSTESQSVIRRVEGWTVSIPRRRRLSALAVVCLITTGLGVTVYRRRQLSGHPPPPQGMKITKLSNGGAWVPSISPDGKYVAYVANNANGELGVWIKVVATGYAYQLVAPAGVNYGMPCFSRDGNYLYYSVQDMNNMSEYFLVDWYRISIAGGASHKVVSSVGGLTFSPDGKQMAFLRVVPSRQAHDLILCKDDGTDERVIATRHWPEISWVLTWSPDGRLIAFGARNRDGDSFYNTVMAVPVEGGPEQPLTSHRWLDVGGALWLGDGSGLLVTGHEQLTDPLQIYFISYPSGEVSSVTNDTNSYSALSITADSRTLVAEMADVTSNIWIAPDGDASWARQITTGGKDGLGGLAWTPDGKIVYASASRDTPGASGNRAIWIINSDGSNPRQLTVDDGVDTNPAVTPDGRRIVFASHRAGAWGIWRAEMDAGNSALLASGGTTTFPVCSPDGQWVFFRRLGSAGPPRIWRVPFAGGEAIELSDKHAYYPAVSPDGNWVAFFSPSETKIRLLVIPSTGGEPVKTFDVTPETDYLIFSEIVRWTADGHYLTYTKNQGDTSNIWGQPFAGGAPRRLTNFDAERIFSFAWSPDGKQLAVARGQYNRQIVLLSNFR